MNPGTRPARSSRFSHSPDNNPLDAAARTSPASPASRIALDAGRDGQGSDGQGGDGQATEDQGTEDQADEDQGTEDQGDEDGRPVHPEIAPRSLGCFAGQPEQVARARHFVAAALAGCPAAGDAELLTSELATNAVQHSASGHGGTFAVAISHAPGRVRITVTDGGSATFPAVAAAEDELTTSGRGLLLVDALADGWGFASAADRPGHPGDAARLPPGRLPPGGAVWFELACS